jgi:hypothetical protein
VERFLLRADLQGYSYRDILEVKPDSLRMLRPSVKARMLSRWTSTLFALGYLFVLGTFISYVTFAGWMISGIVGLFVIALLVAFFFAGLIVLLLWWDDRSLPILAENPDAAIPVEFLGVTSFGTFQEIRGQSNGQELRIAVHASKRKFDEILQFAGLDRPQG